MKINTLTDQVCMQWRTRAQKTSMPKETWAIYQELGLIDGERRRTWEYVNSVHILGYYFYPDVDMESAELAAMYMTWFFIVDDLFDEGVVIDRIEAKNCIKRIQKALLGEHLEEMTPEEKLTALVRMGMARLCVGRESLLERWIDENLDWLDEILHFLTLQDSAGERYKYEYSRGVNIGAIPCLTTGEIFKGYKLSNRFFRNPHVQQIRNLVAHHTALLNDICSCHQDILNERKANLVLIVMNDKSIPVEIALQTITDRLIATEKRISALTDLLLTACEGMPDGEEVRRGFVSICENFMGGHISWALACRRYAV